MLHIGFSTNTELLLRNWQNDQVFKRKGVYQSFGGKELYPTKKEKGARLGYTLISNHAFLDGNKRIGMYVMLTFLEVNGIMLECSNEDIVEAGLGVASGRMDYEGLLSWVIDHEIKYN